MKLQTYLQDTIQAITDNKEIIVNQIYYLQCLQQIQAVNAPKNLTVRLVWDIARGIQVINDIKNKAYNIDGVHDEHIETLITAAIKQSGIMDDLKNLSAETKEKIMLNAKDSAEKASNHEKEKQRQEEEKQTAERERIEREQKQEIDNRNAARFLYHGYGVDMTDKQFDKFHATMNEKKYFDGKLITEREYIEKLIHEYSGYPLIIPKGDKKNKKPFDLFEIHYFNGKNHYGSINEYCPNVKKSMFLYAEYLHGEKDYIVETKSGDTKTESKYTAKNPLEAIKKHCAVIGMDYSKLAAFTSDTGVCRGELHCDNPKQFTAKEATTAA